MKCVLMVEDIGGAFGTCEPRRFAEGRCVQMVERVIRDRVGPLLWSELPFEAGVELCEEEI